MNQTPIITRTFQLLLLIFLLTGTVSAAVTQDEHWYQIELVIFENTDSGLDSNEVWPQDPGLPMADNAIEFIIQPPPAKPATSATAQAIAQDQTLTHLGLAATSPAGNLVDDRPTPFALLETAQLSLIETVSKMQATHHYKPLIHIAWRQPVQARDTAKPIHINTKELVTRQRLAASPVIAGDVTTDNLSIDDQVAINGADDIATEVIDNLAQGFITVVRERYLHLYVDLLYQQATTEQPLFSFFGMGTAVNEINQYRMQQKRRLRSGELHYFDHPKFGVLAKISPFDGTQEEDESVNIIPLR